MPRVCQMHCKKARVRHCKSNFPLQIVEVGKKKTFITFFPGQFTAQSYILCDILNSLQNVNSIWSNSKLLITLHFADIKCYRRPETQIQKTCIKGMLCISAIAAAMAAECVFCQYLLKNSAYIPTYSKNFLS